MTQREKRVAKLLNASKTITWAELVSALKVLGFVLESGKGGSHFSFYNEKTDQRIKEIVKPHGGKKHVKLVYVKKIINFINE